MYKSTYRINMEAQSDIKDKKNNGKKKAGIALGGIAVGGALGGGISHAISKRKINDLTKKANKLDKKAIALGTAIGLPVGYAISNPERIPYMMGKRLWDVFF